MSLFVRGFAHPQAVGFQNLLKSAELGNQVGGTCANRTYRNVFWGASTTLAHRNRTFFNFPEKLVRLFLTFYLARQN